MSLQIYQGEHLPLPDWQPAEMLQDAVRETLAIHATSRIGDVGSGLHDVRSRTQQLKTARQTTPRRAGGTGRDAIHPWRKRFVQSEPVHGPIDGNERLLRHILRIIGIVDVNAGPATHDRIQSLEQKVSCRVIPGPPEAEKYTGSVQLLSGGGHTLIRRRGRHHIRACLVTLALLGPSASLAWTQPRTAGRTDRQVTTVDRRREFSGTYDYRDGDSIIVAPDPLRPGQLLALLEETRYPLRPAGRDRFLNVANDTIAFVRDASGVVTQVVERGTRFRRRSPVLPLRLALMLAPRMTTTGDVVRTARYRPPQALRDNIAVGSVGEFAVPEGPLTTMLQRVLDGTYADVDAVLLSVEGRLVLEEYFHGTTQDLPHQLRSATKTVIALLAGIAIDRGHLSGESEPVLPWLGRHVGPAAFDTLVRTPRVDLTLGDLLSMRPGLACNDWDPQSPGREMLLYQQPDWIRAFLELPFLEAPGKHARYCSASALAAGRIIEHATQRALPDFAQEVLFRRLGVADTAHPWRFALDSSSQRDFAQLRLRPRDLLKLGLLIQQHGCWMGQQVVSADWISRMTTRRATLNSREYGLLVWHQDFSLRQADTTVRVATVGASGHGGQKIYVVPTLDAVVVFTGSGYGSDASSAANTMMAAHVLPALLSRATAMRKKPQHGLARSDCVAPQPPPQSVGTGTC